MFSIFFCERGKGIFSDDEIFDKLKNFLKHSQKKNIKKGRLKGGIILLVFKLKKNYGRYRGRTGGLAINSRTLYQLS
jgi:hypothetical protein